MLDPRNGNTHLDANALEPPDPADKALVHEFLKLRDDEVISIVNPHGVQREISHSRTPGRTKSNMEGIFTIPTNLTSKEQEDLSRLQNLMRGNACPGRHAADADHIFEASKYGGFYFVTHDERILGKKSEIASILGPRPVIVSLRQLIEICRHYCLV